MEITITEPNAHSIDPWHASWGTSPHPWEGQFHMAKKQV